MCSALHGQSQLFGSLLAACLLFVTDAAAETELLMIRQQGCPWCEAWDEEIGPIYPKTAEAKMAPLREADITEIPGDVTLQRPARYTPTFVLLEDGAEVGRIEGYPGEDFFWSLLDRLLKAPTDDTATPVTGEETE